MALVSSSGYESGQGRHPPCQLLYLFHRAGAPMARIVAHLSGFTSILCSMSRNPKNLPASTPNTHFSRFSFKRYLVVVANSSSKSAVLSPLLRGHHHIVYVGLHISSQQRCQDLIHQPLIGGACIFQAERHHCVTVTGCLGHERHLALVTGVHLDLVVPRERFQKAKHLAARGAVHQRVNAWQWVRVLWARLVEVNEVYAHPPLPIGLLN